MDEIISEINEAISRIGDRPGLCLYYAKETIAILRRHGLQAVIQAGSFQWPCLREDDGVSYTHFAYMWNPTNPINVLAMARGVLPEIHCWVGLVDRQEIVDFSIRHLKAAAAKQGVNWTANDPPAYLWCGVNNIPDGVVYEPDMRASILAAMLMEIAE